VFSILITKQVSLLAPGFQENRLKRRRIKRMKKFNEDLKKYNGYLIDELQEVFFKDPE